jgi:hypothetical protein|eukprot:6196030-Prymnesium_polylepis.1
MQRVAAVEALCCSDSLPGATPQKWPQSPGVMRYARPAHLTGRRDSRVCALSSGCHLVLTHSMRQAGRCKVDVLGRHR